MVLNDQEINLVQRYFEHDLSEAELKALTARIDQDPDFKKEVEKIGFVRKSIIGIVKENKRLDEQPDFSFLQKKTSNNNLMKFGILGLLILASILLWNVYQKRMNEPKNQFFAQTEEFVYSISSDIMRSNENQIDHTSIDQSTQGQLAEIISFYEAKNYAKAEGKILDQLKSAKDIESQEILHWWLINIYLKKDQEDALQSTLEKVMNHPDFNSKIRAKNIYRNLFK